MYTLSKVTIAILLLILWICIFFPEPSSAYKSPFSMAENVFNFIENSFANPRRQLYVISFNLEDKIVYKLGLQMLAASKMRASGGKTRAYYSKVQLGGTQKLLNGTPINLNRNIVAIAPSYNSSMWPKYLDLMEKSEVNSAILVFVGTLGLDKEQRLWEEIQTLSKNAMFYLTYELKYTQHDFLLNRVISVGGYKQKIRNRLRFDSHGKLLIEYDLQGLHIESMTESWEPYLKLYGCNDEKKQCKSEGYLADVMDIMGKIMNFTWVAHGRKDSNWGTEPLPVFLNSSRVWDVILGDISYGEYQISIR